LGWGRRKEDRHNKIQQVVTDFKRYENEKDLGEGIIPIHQDCNIYVSEADPAVDQDFVLAKGRQAYLVCIEGKLSISDLVHLNTRDAVEVRIQANIISDPRSSYSSLTLLSSVFFTGEISPEGETFLPLAYFWRNLDPKKTF
jgi:hypothetical protein